MTRQRRRGPTAHRRPRSRRGIAALVVLACLSLAVIVGTVLLQSGAAEQRFTNRLVAQARAEWLAEAGIDRAAAQLARSPRYSGETWPISASQLDGSPSESSGGALIHIQVRMAPMDPKIRIVHVTADLNPGEPLALQATKEIRLPTTPN